MKKLFSLVALALPTVLFIGAGDEASPAQLAGEREGVASIIHGGEILRDREANRAAGRHLWPLYSSAEARMNYFEVTGPSPLHFHPDADHRLYILEGKVVVTAGTNTTTATACDLIVIPKGVRHRYDVPVKGDHALLLTFDAPPYDPGKTVNIESSRTSK